MTAFWDGFFGGFWTGGVLFAWLMWFATRRLAAQNRRMRDALEMKGAPEAPCFRCRERPLSDCRSCHCLCHRERAEYVSRLFDEALKGDAYERAVD